MKWMKERDLLIAQTMAFVESVTGKSRTPRWPSARRCHCSPPSFRSHTAGHSPFRPRRCRHRGAACADATCRASAPTAPSNRQKLAPIATDRYRSRFRCVPTSGGFPVRDKGTGRQFPRPSGALQPGARGLLQRHHGQGPRRAAGKRPRRRGSANSLPSRAPDSSGISAASRSHSTLHGVVYAILSGSVLWRLTPRDLLQHRQQVLQKLLRILAHREMAEPLHDGDLAAGNAVGHRQRLLRRAGIVVFA